VGSAILILSERVGLMFSPEDSIDETTGSSRMEWSWNDERGLPLRKPPQALTMIRRNQRKEA